MQKSGNIVYVPILAIVTGIIILAISFLRLTRFITLIPSSALHGFLLGVGITIASSQFNSALGITPSIQHETIYQNLLQTFSQITQTNWLAFLLFLVSFIFLLLMKRFVPKIPGAVPLTVIGIALGGLATYLQSTHMWPTFLPLVQTIASKFPSLAFSLMDIPKFSSI
jgi:MFS superfamily sulfate permease-like transporter